MPPTFPYIVGLAAYLIGTSAVLIASMLMFFFPNTRMLARRLGAGALASFPSMIAHQVLAFPLTILIIALGRVAFSLESHLRGAEVFVGIPLLLSSIICFAIASAYGIYFGYKLSWELFAGTTLKGTLLNHFVGQMVRRFFWNKRPV